MILYYVLEKYNIKKENIIWRGMVLLKLYVLLELHVML